MMDTRGEMASSVCSRERTVVLGSRIGSEKQAIERGQIAIIKTTAALITAEASQQHLRSEILAWLFKKPCISRIDKALSRRLQTKLRHKAIRA
ncbi:hypothetical protein HPB50_018293 [Hyalomma asiaticum]|uniref:Uncharacterized protein n=1 Tax=Hyalomma asiaticum TaxID=266040 RepID=A0ACB7SIR2_HYAAI|nr:hypothetical protein HPB50_018293 [Hyalomma asiaticum]